MSRARRLACLVASLATSTGAVVLLVAPASRAGASGPAAAAVALVASSPATTAGSSLTLTATVTGATPTGQVAFLDDGAPLACGGSSTVSLQGGVAETAVCAISSVAGPPGPHSYTALYLGDSANLPGSASLEEPVAPVTTTTTLSAPAAGAGSPVTLGATVTATAGSTPTGSVVFSDDGVALSACGGSAGTALAAGVAQCTLASGYPAPGSQLVEASYSGSTADGPSLASAVEVIGTPPVGVASTSTRLDASSRTPGAGVPVTFGAVVTGAASPAAPPSGTVTFTAGGVALPSCHDLAVSPVAGSDQAGATCTVADGFPAPSPTDLQALFTPAAGATVAPSLSSAVAVDPMPGAGAVTVTASPDPAPGGSPVTLTASVAADATGAPATGSVQFDLGGAAASCTGATGGLVLLASGSASCTVAAPSPGATLATAAFLGSATLQPATAVAPLTVDAPLAATAVRLASSINPVAANTAVTYTATASGGATTPTGSVTFKANGALVSGCASVALSAGTATCTVGSGYGTTGTVVVTATYSGDGAHLAGAGQMSEDVTALGLTAPAMAVTASADPVASGDAVTYTASVSGATGTPTGAVTFTDGGSAIASCASPVTLTPQGGTTAEASCTVPAGYPADLTHLIVASYPGDGATFTAASAALAEEVLPRSPTLALSPSPASAVAGSAQTLTAALAGSLGAPSGTATFGEGGGPVASCQSVGLVTGVASCSLPAPPAAGAVAAAVAYSGDVFYAPAVAAIGDEAGQTGASPATVQLSATPSASVGTDVRYTVTVAGSGSTPTGSVTLSDGGVPVAACGSNGTTSLAAGSATCDAGTAVAAGVHDVVATYSGDATYAPAAALLAELVTGATASGAGGGTGGGSPSGGSSGGAPSGGGVPGPGGGASPGGATGSGAAGGASPGAPSAPGTQGGIGRPSGSSSAAPGPAPAPGHGPGDTGTARAGGGTALPGGTSRHPTLKLSAPRVGLPHRSVVFRARVAGRRGAIGGTVTFSVDGHAVRGCTRVPLGPVSSLQVTCTLAFGFASPGYQVVRVTFSGSRRYDATASSALEDVVPAWSGYWIVSASGRAVAYGGAAAVAAPRIRGPVVGAAMSPDARGLWLLSRAGAVIALGADRPYGSAPSARGPYSAIAATRDGHGYWILARDGVVVARGDARPFAPARATARTGPYVAIAATPDGLGCWLLSSRGIVVARGDARTYPLRAGRLRGAGPFVAIAPSGDGRGYRLLAAGGTLVSYGDARPLAARVRPPAGGFAGLVSTADHRGLWLVSRRGAVVALGDAARFPPTKPPAPAATAIVGT